MGYVFGLGSRMMGTERILKTGIWVENKAVEHYGKLLAGADWDEETRAFIEKDWADEYGHIARWEGFLKESLSDSWFVRGDMVDSRPA